jgi:hypothetical protein
MALCFVYVKDITILIEKCQDILVIYINDVTLFAVIVGKVSLLRSDAGSDMIPSGHRQAAADMGFGVVYRRAGARRSPDLSTTCQLGEAGDRIVPAARTQECGGITFRRYRRATASQEDAE